MTDYWKELRTQAQTLGALVLQARLADNFSQGELVDRLDPFSAYPQINVPALSRVENGQMVPDQILGLALSTWLISYNHTLPTTPLARTTDPTTSHEAAASVNRVKMRELHFWWLHHLDFIWRDPNAIDQLNFNGEPRGYFATDEGARRFYDGPKVSSSGFRTRRAELRHAGLVVDSGRRYQIETGRQAIAWKLTPAGVAILKETPQP